MGRNSLEEMDEMGGRNNKNQNEGFLGIPNTFGMICQAPKPRGGLMPPSRRMQKEAGEFREISNFGQPVRSEKKQSIPEISSLDAHFWEKKEVAFNFNDFTFSAIPSKKKSPKSGKKMPLAVSQNIRVSNVSDDDDDCDGIE